MNASLLLIALVCWVGDWPAFLGRGADPIDVTGFPQRWSATENVAWRAAITGYGQSTPVVFGDRVFVTSVSGENKENLHISCYALGDGGLVWSESFTASDTAKNDVYVSRAAPTPVVDAERLVAFFESGDLVSMSHDGKVNWQRSLSADYGKFQNRFCIGSSPCADADRVFLLIDHEGPSYLLAIDKKTGETLWKTERESRVAWSSPILDSIDGQPMVVCSSQGSVDGYDVQNGQKLWSYEDVGGNTVASAFAVASGRYLIGASPGQGGEDAEIAKRSNLLLEVTRSADGWAAKPVWIAERVSCSFSSPIAYEGVAYWVNKQGVVHGVDLATGESLFDERLDESCWATALPVGDRIYFFGRKGDTTVLAAGKEFRKIETLRTSEPLGEPAGPGNFGGVNVYGVAVATDQLLIRTGSELTCVRRAQ